jgi:hypothetical protein
LCVSSQFLHAYQRFYEIGFVEVLSSFPVGDLYSVGALQPDTKSYNVFAEKAVFGFHEETFEFSYQADTKPAKVSSFL